MAKRLEIIDSAKAAYRLTWQDRRSVCAVSWLTILLGFGLMALPALFPALRQPCRVAFRVLLSVIAVALLRKDILGEKPDIKKAAGIPFYFRFGRHEALYGAWTCAILAVFYITGKAEALAEHLPFIGPLVATLVWPLMRDLFLAMLALVRPYIAVTADPAFDALSGLIEAAIGNIVNIMMTTLTIFLPYIIMTGIFYFFAEYIGFRTAWHCAEHALYCLCAIVEVKFLGTAYKVLYAAQPPASRPR